VDGRVGRFNGLSGQRFGRWLVTPSWERRMWSKGGKVVYWLCRSSCPAHSRRKIKVARIAKLRVFGQRTFCTKEAKEIRNIDHPLHRIWETLKQRCYNKHSRDYLRLKDKQQQLSSGKRGVADRRRAWYKVTSVSPLPWGRVSKLIAGRTSF
jgi:hypothetical protein